MTRVLFLPDYGTSVGGGHVMRCLTLAAALKARGAECGFCVLPEAQAVIRAFAGDAYALVDADWAAPVAVIDGYDYGASHEQALAAQGRRVVALDDLARVHDCDVVVDSDPMRTPSDYPGRARALLGLDYALLRPEFVQAKRAPEAGRVLVSLGLTDVGGVTRRVLALMLEREGWTSADVVLGPTASSLEFVRELAARDPRITLHVNSQDMAGLSARAEFAVGASGGSLWERAVMGLPSLVLVLAPNQARNAGFMQEQGAALVLDADDPLFDSDFALAFDKLAGDGAARAVLSARSSGLCDGLGAQRVADAVLSLAPR